MLSSRLQLDAPRSMTAVGIHRWSTQYRPKSHPIVTQTTTADSAGHITIYEPCGGAYVVHAVSTANIFNRN